MNTFKLYLPLCWFKANPLDLPKSTAFFKQNLWFYFIVELFIQVNMIDGYEAFFEVVIETSLTLGFIAIILLLNRNLSTYLQVATAILFCENVVAFLGLPIIMWLTVSDGLLSYYLFAMLILWDYALITSIFKNVIGINMAASLTIGFFYFTMSYALAYGITVLLF